MSNDSMEQWGTVAFDRNLMQRLIRFDQSSRAMVLGDWFAVVPEAYKADVVECVRRIEDRFVGQKADSATLAAFVPALHDDIRKNVPYREPVTPADVAQRHDEMWKASGYQHSPATYVEGREAPKPCEDHDEFCLACGIANAATVEACARAAYEAAHPQEGYYTPTPWDDVDGDTRKLYLVVTRAVLAAAKGAGR